MFENVQIALSVMSIVFIGLACLFFIVMLFSFIIRKVEKVMEAKRQSQQARS